MTWVGLPVPPCSAVPSDKCWYPSSAVSHVAHSSPMSCCCSKPVSEGCAMRCRGSCRHWTRGCATRCWRASSGAPYQAAVIVARGGMVLHINAAAEALMPSVLRMRHHRLHAAEGRCESVLSGFLNQLTSTQRCDTRTCDPILLTSSGGEQILVRGLPLPGIANDLFRQANALILFETLAPRAPPVALLRSVSA